MTEDQHEAFEQARMKIGASLMELRVAKERFTRMLTRAEYAYVELSDLLETIEGQLPRS